MTPKTRPEDAGFPWRLAWPQPVATVVLTIACVVGVVRLLVHAQTGTVGTAVNVSWVAYDLLVLSIIYRGALHRAPEPTEETA